VIEPPSLCEERPAGVTTAATTAVWGWMWLGINRRMWAFLLSNCLCVSRVVHHVRVRGGQP